MELRNVSGFYLLKLVLNECSILTFPTCVIFAEVRLGLGSAPHLLFQRYIKYPWVAEQLAKIERAVFETLSIKNMHGNFCK